MPTYNDKTWARALAGFGAKGGWEWTTRTAWTTSDIWLRQSFEYSGEAFDRAMLVTHYDNATEVYVNGKELWHADGWNNRYDGFDVTAQARAALKKGSNVIAVHCHQDTGGQYIDVALLTGTH
jgi:beta-galactosidase